MWSDLLRIIEESIHSARCNLAQQEDEALFQQCLEIFESFFNSEGYEFWMTALGGIVLILIVGKHLWVQGTMTLRHLALFRNTGTILMSIIAIVTISSWLYAMNLTASFVDFATLSITLLVSAPLIVLYISIIFNANYRILAETSAERRLKMNILLFAQLAIVLIAAALMGTTLEIGAVGMILIYISPLLRAQIHKRWSI